MNEHDVFIATCGVDVQNNAKSLIRVDCKFIPVKRDEEEEVVDGKSLDGPIINIFRSMRHTMIDVSFDDNADYAYINTVSMLQDFCKPENSLYDGSEKIPAIVLTLVPKELNGEYYICGIHPTWALIPSRPNILPDTIRFIFDNDFVNTFHVDPDQFIPHE